MPAVAYRFSMDFVSRGNTRGRATSATAKAAYNAREKINDQATGITYDFRAKDGLEWAGVFLPEGSPERWQDRATRWNEAEQAEAKKDGTLRARAQTARTVDIALPADLTPQEMKQVLTDFAREEWQRKGILADVALHQPDIEGGKNWHAHVMLATREVTPDGFGEKIRGDWKTRGEFEKYRVAELEHYKERFAELCANRLERKAEALEKDGLTDEAAALKVTAERWRYGHLAIDGQREKALERGDLDYIDQLKDGPTKHRGPDISGLEARGEVSEVQERRAAERAPEAAANDDLYRAELPDMLAELAALRKEEAALLRDVRQENARHEKEPASERDQDRTVDRTDVDGGDAKETARGIVAEVGAIAGAGFVMFGKAAERVAKIGEDLLSLGDFGATKDTPQQRWHKAENVQARAEKREAEAIDAMRYLKDDKYAQQVREQREEQERLDRERESYVKDRERGGRDR
jgi:hypothetical protein